MSFSKTRVRQIISIYNSKYLKISLKKVSLEQYAFLYISSWG